MWLIDWKHPDHNDFAFAEEVTVAAIDPKAFGKRPDIVLYINGIALAVLELKRSTVSVAEGIRQNLDNQKKVFIEHFFSTIQLVMAGNDTEGLHYGAIETKEKYYLTWKEPGTIGNPLDRSLLQMCDIPPAMLVGVADVAGMLSASERTVWRLSDAGKMPAPVRIGRLARWSRQAILDWIEAGCPAVRGS